MQVAQDVQDVPRGAALPQLSLVAIYAPHPGQPTIILPMHRHDTSVLEQRVFEYRGDIVASHALTVPQTYFIVDHEAEMATVLDRHKVPYTRLQHPIQAHVILQHIRAIYPPSGKGTAPQIDLRERVETMPLSAGTLRIDLGGPTARFVPLLLDPRSISSVFHFPPYTRLLAPNMDFFVLRSTNREG